jgi:hypothetical protein
MVSCESELPVSSEEDVAQLSQAARVAAIAAAAESGAGKLSADRLLAFAAVFLAEIVGEVAQQRQRGNISSASLAAKVYIYDLHASCNPNLAPL